MRSTIQRGFTLLELMITVAIVGIVATIAIWNSKDTLESNRAENYLLDLKRMISFARAKAVSTDSFVTVCRGWEDRIKSNKVQICKPLSSPTDYEQVYFSYTNDNKQYQTNYLRYFEPYFGDKVLRVLPPPKENDRLVYSGDAEMIFDSSGAILNNVGTFVYCPNSTDNKNNKALTVYKSGTVFYNGDTNLTCD